jgi:hypothetical protein
MRDCIHRIGEVQNTPFWRQLQGDGTVNKKSAVRALSLVILIGILVFAERPLFLSELAPGARLAEDAAPDTAVALVPVAEVSARFDQVATVLSKSVTGSELLEMQETYHVSVQFEEGHGSRFRKGSNLILLDTRHDPVKAAMYFAHEMVHAQSFNEGKSADIDSESRQAYIDLKIQEEVEGMVASFMVRMELRRIGVDVAETNFPMEDTFHQAYQAATEQAGQMDSSLRAQELEAIGQAAGAQALFDAFSSGKIRTSNTHEPYTEYFATRWDEANDF